MSIYTWTAQNIRESGLMINNKVKDMRPGLMVRFTRGSTMKGRSMGEGSSTGRITLNMMGNSATMRFMVRGRIPGRMGDFTRGTGKRTRCPGRGSLPGLMGGTMLVVTLTIKRKVMGCSHGPTEENTLVTGRRGNNQGRENIKEVINKLKPVSGRTEEESDGLMRKELLQNDHDFP